MRRKGFTLIELLVVIAIIAVLAALLFPLFNSAKERSRQIKCLSNLKELGIAFQNYCDDYYGGTPFAGWSIWSAAHGNWCGCAGPGSSTVILKNAQLWKYARSPGIFICPSDIGRKGKYVPADYPISYSINDDLCSGDGRLPVKLGFLKCRKQSRVMLFIHEARGNPSSPSIVGINDGIFVPGQYDSGQDFGEKIHYTGTTLVYVDGHARWGSLDNLQNERCVDKYWDVKR